MVWDKYLQIYENQIIINETLKSRKPQKPDMTLSEIVEAYNQTPSRDNTSKETKERVASKMNLLADIIGKDKVIRQITADDLQELVYTRPVTFSDFKFDKAGLTNILQTYEFSNRRPITKSMLTWWAYQDEKQEILSLDTVLEIEHIFARNRQENEKSLQDENNLECLGNKALLEKRINIRASDYRFSDKKKYYQGYTKGKTVKERTHINELLELSLKDDFNEKDIIQRNRVIVDKFIGYLRKENLLNE